ncbi:uncharacterized protein LOC111391268 [Olea europaea var. sylvestris]|uniref:uncharacterized protein LOC111391268 n=1 Tax=Olea europaea var. sylvestris TaxID=158386 RepID=UPI000C1D042F|nr:uncharacterized protein LOC111391268 [Olea europaea var. sylvestris]
MEQDEQPKTSIAKESSEKAGNKATVTVNPYEPPIPFPQRLKKHKMEQQYKKFLEVFKKLHIDIPFADVLVQMPSYAKFLKDVLSNKRKLEEHEMIMLTEKCSTRIQKKLPSKLKDPWSFTVPCTIGEVYFYKALWDFGASINLMPLFVFRRLDLGEAKATTVTLQLADRPFLAIDRALIDVQMGQLILKLGEERISFNVFKAMKLPTESDSCFQINVIDKVVQDTFRLKVQKMLIRHTLHSLNQFTQILWRLKHVQGSWRLIRPTQGKGTLRSLEWDLKSYYHPFRSHLIGT